jgi:hypothetical protein
VTFRCEDLAEALRAESGERLREAAAHAETCDNCREELALWREISAAAPSLRRDWETADLWPRIRRDLSAERAKPPARRLGNVGWLSLAAALLAAVSAAVFFVGPRRHTTDQADAERRLLTEEALAQVEQSEAAYIESIERLAKTAQPLLEAPASPLLVSYREKLMVIDAAIAECRGRIETNRFNAYLRRELLSVYREKQRTLEDLMREDKNAL